jgi:inosine/xanthosine triphosphate pyrophosphatase family protein
MGSISGPGRRAYFACTLYAILPTEKVGKTEDVAIFQNERFGHGLVGVSTEGRLWGSIGFTPSGEGGFGYDPVFHPDVDPKRTLAQFEMDEKNMISHRGVAFENLRKALSQGSGPR